MKLHILSDLHVEFDEFSIPEIGADVVILAGDIHLGDLGLRWILEQWLQPHVLYVPGNHEFYHNTFPGLIDDLRRKSRGTSRACGSTATPTTALITPSGTPGLYAIQGLCSGCLERRF